MRPIDRLTPQSDAASPRAKGDRVQSVRTDRASMCPPLSPTADASPVQDAPIGSTDDPTSDDFVRTQPANSTAPLIRAPLAPAGWARMFVADHLTVSLARRKNEGSEWATKRGLASTCKLDERIVRQWCNGQKALPVGALLVLPAPLATDLLGAIQDRRALTPHRRGLPMLAEALTRLEKPVTFDDRDEVVDGLLEAQARISALLGRLARGGDR